MEPTNPYEKLSKEVSEREKASLSSFVVLVVIAFLLLSIGVSILLDLRNTQPSDVLKAQSQFRDEVITALDNLKKRTDDRVYRKEILELLKRNPELIRPPSLQKDSR